MKKINMIEVVVLLIAIAIVLALVIVIIVVKIVPHTPNNIPMVTHTAEPYSNLLDAMEHVESGCFTSAIGKNSEVGILQISKICIDDVNRIYTLDFKYNDRYDRKKSRLIAILYLKYYGKVYTKATGKVPTDEVLARIWNGGPTGYLKKSTVKYWKAVKNRMEVL